MKKNRPPQKFQRMMTKVLIENQNNEIKSSDNSVSDSKNVDSADKESVLKIKKLNRENKKE